MVTRKAFLALTLSFAAMPVFAADPPAVGAVAPVFKLNTPEGKPVSLAALEKKGPVALVFLRGFPGYQCPYCTKQVHDFVENSDKFTAAHTQVLLIYPGPPADLDQRAKEFIAKQQGDLPANIHLVIDPDYTVTNLYNLRWDKPRETAYPSTFVLKNGKVTFAKISRAHGDRMSATDTLAEIAK